MGQFATPPALAHDIVSYGLALLGNSVPLRFLDPAFGTGAFYSALLRCAPAEQIESATGFEIDPHYGVPARDLWKSTPLHLELEDFTRAAAPNAKSNLIICNPPYVRHHHVGNEDKLRLQALAKRLSGEDLSGLTGLYGYFLLLADAWMNTGGVAGWLIPSEFMDVNYGRAIKRYLLGSQVTLLHIHRFDAHDVQFDDALVSSTVVWLRKAPPPAGHSVDFSFGGSLSQPRIVRRISLTDLRHVAKWSRLPSETPTSPSHVGPRLKDLFAIKRGLATGDNKFFVLSRGAIEERGLPLDVFKPVLPPPRGLPIDEVLADHVGYPQGAAPLFLLDCRIPEGQLADRYPRLAAYVAEGRARGVHEGYLCSRRTPWYSQEHRPAPPFLCTYMGRGTLEGASPFRFILNHSLATATNVYLLLYPRPELAAVIAVHPELKRSIWEALQRIDVEHLVREGRVYGGGLHKLEPKELANAPADELLKILPADLAAASSRPPDLFAAAHE